MRTNIRRVTLAGLATLATLTFGAGSASAATGGLESLSSFSGPIANFLVPSGLAVNQTNGDVYVAEGETAYDGGTQSLYVFSSEGSLKTTLQAHNHANYKLNGISVSTATGRIYVAEDGAGRVILFNAAGAVEGEWEGLGTPQGEFDRRYGLNVEVAVDNSTSHADVSAGDVYVLDSNAGVVDKLSPEGTEEKYLSQFNGGETPAGSFPGEGGLDGIAVDASGDVYVSDSVDHVVDVFSPEGKYLRQLTGMTSPGSIAINGADGDVYVVDDASGLVDVFNATGEPQGALVGPSSGFFTTPRGIAVNETSGEVYVLDAGTKAVDGYGPASQPLPPQPNTEAPSSDMGTSVTLNGTLNPGGVGTNYFFSYDESATSCAGHLTPITGAGSGASPVHGEATIAVEPDTQYTVCVYALVGQMAHVGPPVTFTTTALKPTVEATGFTTTLTFTAFEPVVNANKQTTTCEIEYGLSEAYGTTVPCEPGELEAVYEPQHPGLTLHGLLPHTVYHYRVIATNATGTTYSADQAVKTPGPLATTGAVSAVGQTSANVTGTVNPDGAETYYYYEYGTTTEYGETTAPEGAGVDVGSGTTPVAAPASLIPLVPGVTYHYRLVSWSEQGTTYGQDQTFTTEAGHSPAGNTVAASGITVDEATISGTVNPEGKETSYRFEYGENTTYGTVVFGTVQPEQGVDNVTLPLRGIQPNTTYHYRIVVSNAGGTVYGEDMTFTTLPIAFPLIAPTPPPLLALPSFTFPTGNEVGTTNTGKSKKSGKKKHGKKKHKKTKAKQKASGRGKKKKG
jgi:DNA-binding beta-propeller fold protein YncE